MFRSGNVPFTATPVYAPEDITGYYVRIGSGPHQPFATLHDAHDYAARAYAPGRREVGSFIRPGAEPVRHDLSPLYFRRAILSRREV